MKKLIEQLRNLRDKAARGMIEPGSDEADTLELLEHYWIMGRLD